MRTRSHFSPDNPRGLPAATRVLLATLTLGVDSNNDMEWGERAMRFIAPILAALLITVGGAARADIAGNPEKISGWVVAYETDAAGDVVRGNLDRLVTAVRSGADIKLGFGDPVTGIRPCVLVDLVTIDAVEQVGCSFGGGSASILSGVNPFVLRPNPYFAYQWVDTLGRNVIVRALVAGGGSAGTTVTETVVAPITWYAKVR